MKINMRFRYVFVCFLGLFLVFGLSVSWIKFMLNISGSEPVGLYLVRTDIPNVISRGTLVVSCIPIKYADIAFHRTYLRASDQCPGHVITVLKRIYAVPGDTVRLTRKAVIVNDHPIPGTKRLSVDTRGNPVPHEKIDGKISGYLLLAAKYRLSFDGRYFGPVDRSFIKGIALPVLTFRRNK